MKSVMIYILWVVMDSRSHIRVNKNAASVEVK